VFENKRIDFINSMLMVIVDTFIGIEKAFPDDPWVRLE